MLPHRSVNYLPCLNSMHDHSVLSFHCPNNVWCSDAVFSSILCSDATNLYGPVSHRKLWSLPTWHGLNATFHSNQSVSAVIVMFMVESEQTDSPAACLYDYYRILRMGHYRMPIPLTPFPVHHSLNTITQSAILLTVFRRCVILM